MQPRTPARRGRSRLWLQGREADALERLADPSAGELADDAGQLVALAIQAGERHAATIGVALARWDDDVAAYRILKTACESLIDEVSAGGADALGAPSASR